MKYFDQEDLSEARAAVRRVPLHALDGRECGIVCDLCPLRAWKSRAQTGIWCRDVLEGHRLALAANSEAGLGRRH